MYNRVVCQNLKWTIFWKTQNSSKSTMFFRPELTLNTLKWQQTCLSLIWVGIQSKNLRNFNVWHNAGRVSRNGQYVRLKPQRTLRQLLTGVKNPILHNNEPSNRQLNVNLETCDFKNAEKRWEKNWQFFSIFYFFFKRLHKLHFLSAI